MSGAKTAISTPAAATAQGTCAAVAGPAISVRVAVTRWLTGLTVNVSRSADARDRDKSRDRPGGVLAPGLPGGPPRAIPDIKP